MLVWPKNDEIRRVLKHPHNNTGFREKGPVDWPDDSYTHRRIMDRDVTAEEPKVIVDQATAAPAAVKKAPDKV